jgi:hypothetical protein
MSLEDASKACRAIYLEDDDVENHVALWQGASSMHCYVVLPEGTEATIDTEDIA